MFMWRLLSALKPASEDSEIGSLMSLNEFNPVFTLDTIEEPSSLVMYTVMRSASKSWQMSRETSRMISSMLLVEWMRLVTAWSFLEKASFTLMSATLADDCILGSRTALMVAPAKLSRARARIPGCFPACAGASAPRPCRLPSW